MMMNIDLRPKVLARATRHGALCLLALVAVLCQARQAQAQWTTTGTNTTTTNNVGVGTASPQTPLHVSTSSTAINRGVINEQTSADNNAAVYSLRKSRAGAAALNGDNIGNLYAEAFDGASFVSGGRLRFAIDGVVSAGSVPTSMQFFTGTGGNGGVERMRVNSAGNVGIGTTAPAAKLDVNGSANFSGSTTVAGRGTFALDAGNNLNFSMYNSFRVSAASLLVNGALETYDNHFAMRQTSNNTLTVRIPATGSAYFNQGNVGIGTATPSTALHVVGDVTVTGNISAKYQDVAEWVPSTQALAAGTVVALDTTRANHVVASASAYDTRVAGVISAQPGLALGERGEGKVLVATTGRVKIKVDATRAPIRIGDLLVTSDVAGVAMRSEPIAVGGRQLHAPGTIIGKALESLEKGTGEVLVLLSLQ